MAVVDALAFFTNNSLPTTLLMPKTEKYKGCELLKMEEFFLI